MCLVGVYKYQHCKAKELAVTVCYLKCALCGLVSFDRAAQSLWHVARGRCRLCAEGKVQFANTNENWRHHYRRLAHNSSFSATTICAFFLCVCVCRFSFYES